MVPQLESLDVTINCMAAKALSPLIRLRELPLSCLDRHWLGAGELPRSLLRLTVLARGTSEEAEVLVPAAVRHSDLTVNFEKLGNNLASSSMTLAELFPNWARW